MSTQTKPAPLLSAAQRDAFRRDGCLLVRRLLEPQRVEDARQAVADEAGRILDQLAASGAIPSARPDLPFATRLIVARQHLDRYGRSWTGNLAVPAIFALHRDPGLLAALGGLLGADVCGHRQFNARPKLPGQELTVVPWHQDTGYFGESTAGSTIITAWTPLVPVDGRNGCMQVAMGSHRRGWIPHRPAEDAGGFLVAEHVPDPAEIVTMEMQPGDVLLMHNLVLHRSTENASDGIRWSLDMRFYGADVPPSEPLLWGFPSPWRLHGTDATPLATWTGWYGEAGRG